MSHHRQLGEGEQKDGDMLEFGKLENKTACSSVDDLLEARKKVAVPQTEVSTS